jgi:hypothetical protein
MEEAKPDGHPLKDERLDSAEFARQREEAIMGKVAAEEGRLRKFALEDMKMPADLSAKLQEERAPSEGGPQKLPQNMSRNELLREIRRLNVVINRLDMAGLVGRALEKRRSFFKHREAFMLMTYLSDDGLDVLKVWNSRDGVTPFACHVNGKRYQHDLKSMDGPHLDRPNVCDAQWETRTGKAMMEAWERSLNRAAIQGKLTQERLIDMKGDAELAAKNYLFIGLRDLTTGKYTDDF